MHIIMNGKPRSFSGGVVTIKELLALQSLDPAHVVVEINGAIVPKDRFDTLALAPDDRVEILRFVGGG
jgi:thiamine biosynthesis protein ThiS